MIMTNAPYYVIPDIEALRSEKDPDKLRLHRRRIAANIGNPDALRAIIGDSSEDFHDFYGASDSPNLSTEDTIDAFLEKFGTETKEAVHAAADAVDSTVATQTSEPTVPIAPAFDYASMMEARETESVLPETNSDDPTLGVIDSFLSKTPPPRIKPKKEAKADDKPSLTESFAKILIKNGNYQRALEIITEISLNNPEKSIYFADQIRFLKKIVWIESKKQ